MKNCKALKYDEEAAAFENEGVRILNKDIYGDVPYGAPKNGSVPDRNKLVNLAYIPEVLKFDDKKLYLEDAIKFIDDVECMLAGNYSKTETDIIRTTFAEWKACTHVSLGHSSPALATSIYAIYETGKEADVEIQVFSSDSIAIRSTIDLVVKSNHAYKDFDIALMMVIDVMFTPIPKEIEGMPWIYDTIVAQMPRLDCILGIDAQRLLGFGGDPSDSYKTWSNEYVLWTYKSKSKITE